MNSYYQLIDSNIDNIVNKSNDISTTASTNTLSDQPPDLSINHPQLNVTIEYRTCKNIIQKQTLISMKFNNRKMVLELLNLPLKKAELIGKYLYLDDIIIYDKNKTYVILDALTHNYDFKKYKGKSNVILDSSIIKKLIKYYRDND